MVEVSAVQTIRAAYITTVPVIGGAELNLLRLLPHLQQLNVIPVTILSPPGGGLSECFHENGFPLSKFNIYRHNNRAPWRYLQCLWQLTAPIVKSRADLIHINHHYGLEYTVRASQLARKPYIIHMRGIEPTEWVRINLNYLTNAQYVIAESYAVKQRLLKGGLAPDKVKVIYNGVDVESLTKVMPHSRLHKELKIEENTSLIGLIGRMEPLKGVADFLYAAKLILEHIPNARFLIVGNGQEAFVAEMKLLAHTLDLEHYVRFLGFRNDVASILPVLNVLAMATYDPMTGQGESLSIVVLEAMVSRTPVVARRAGGVVELLEDGRGILVEPNGVEPLAEGIIRALTMSEEQRQELVGTAYKSVCADFTIERQARQIKEVYEQVLYKTQH